MSFPRIATNIRYYRERRCFTQKQLSEELNVSRSVIAKWENGTVTPDLKSLIELRRVFEVSIDKIVGVESNTDDLVIEQRNGYVSEDAKKEFEIIDYVMKHSTLKEQLFRMRDLPLKKQKTIHSMIKSMVNEISRI